MNLLPTIPPDAPGIPIKIWEQKVRTELEENIRNWCARTARETEEARRPKSQKGGK